MKTLLLFLDTGALDEPVFFELEGDQRRFHGCFVNGAYDEDDKIVAADDLAKIIYDEKGNFKLQKLDAPTKDWDFFVVCGFYA